MEKKTGSRQEDGKKVGTVPEYGTSTVPRQLLPKPVSEFLRKKLCHYGMFFNITWWLQQAWLSCEAQVSPSSQWPAPKHVNAVNWSRCYGSGSRIQCFFIPGPGSGRGVFPDPWSRIPETNPYLWELGHNFLGSKYLNFLSIGSYNKVYFYTK